MINAILKGLFNLVISLVSLILTPIDALINSAFPSIASGLGYITDFFNYIGGMMSWLLSWFHLPQAFLNLVVGYLIFKLTVPLTIHTIKLALHWYHILKP